ncbi:MAG: phosphoribosylglycinamide formyltransferase [Saprospiraceae bacterium]|nr:phosphoribosylglycinamide formyltransferase [Saprospiraceae bacterium]
MAQQWNLAIFASGGGSNARALIEYFAGHPSIHIRLIISSHPSAGVFQIAAEHAIPAVYLDNKKFAKIAEVMEVLNKFQVNFLVLAGFLKKVPEALLDEFPDKIINIHPSLLPAYGGKGMYGHFVHEAVHHNREKSSGMTIHLVNAHYDEGRILFQAAIPLSPEMTPADIAREVLVLEHRHYAAVLEDYLESIG